MKKLYILSFIILLFFILNCSKSNSDNNDDSPINSTPNSITINAENSYTGMINQIFQLSAVVKNSESEVLNNQAVIWSSNNTAVATVTNIGELQIIGEGQVTITASLGSLEDSKSINIQLTPLNLIAFTVSDLSNELATQGGRAITFLDEPTMSSTLLELNIGESNESTIGNYDQVFYFYEGSGSMTIDGQVVSITEESTVFIKAISNRNITSVDSNMKIIITELKTVSNQNPPLFSKFTYAQIEAQRNANQNIWNPFLNEVSVTFGLYMLPQVVGGDNTLVHNWDELNIITRGASRFQTNEGNVQVERGSIVYVREGNGHAFNNLTNDIDILILWNM